jgi:hypothetical protein
MIWVLLAGAIVVLQASVFIVDNLVLLYQVTASSSQLF